MRRMTKKAMALMLHAEGHTVEEIARQLDTRPTYVANVLAAAGQAPAYHDLYVSSMVQSGYTLPGQGLLRFKDVPAAQHSVRRLDTLYHACAQHHDRRGQHQAQLLALIGKNRAEGLGKYAEAQVFADWLRQHLTVQSPDLATPGYVRDACKNRSQRSAAGLCADPLHNLPHNRTADLACQGGVNLSYTQRCGLG